MSLMSRAQWYASGMLRTALIESRTAQVRLCTARGRLRTALVQSRTALVQSRTARVVVLPLLLTLWGCNQTVELYEVALQGTVRAAEDVQTGGVVTVETFHAWSGEGALAHPLEFIERFEIDAAGEFAHTLYYPIAGGEGLVVYAWQDRDDDGVLCAPGQEAELAGLVEVVPFPVHDVEVELVMDQPCAGPEALFPP